jgi:scyllo-inositol 2-dehydrogenase (NADP+)
MDGKYNLAIVGYGGMGTQHGKLLKTVERINVIGVFDIDETRKKAAQTDGFKAYDSFDEVLGDKQVDIILIATPNHLHKDIAIKALKAGKNVICEKPVTLNSRQLEEIIKAADECGKLFVVHQNRRWDEDYLVMKKIYDEKLIGEVYNIETRVMGSRGIPGDWRHQKEFGGGMLLDWGIHLLDRLLVMIDEKVKTVYCNLSYVLGNDVDDGFKLFLKFESGKTAMVEVQTNNMVTLPKWYMCGEFGTAVIDDWEMNGKYVTLKTFDDKDAKPIEAGAGLSKTMAPRDSGTINTHSIPRIESDVRDYYKNVVDALDGKKEIIVKNKQALRVMKLVDAAFESDKKNSVINFE